MYGSEGAKKKNGVIGVQRGSEALGNWPRTRSLCLRMKFPEQQQDFDRRGVEEINPLTSFFLTLEFLSPVSTGQTQPEAMGQTSLEDIALGSVCHGKETEDREGCVIHAAV